MSGVEVVGLILGAIPLIISAAEYYKKGFEPIGRWKRFKFVFREFITSVDIQRQMFQLVLKKLLIRVQLEPEEKQRLLTTPDYEGWRRADIIDALKLRLGDSYDACIDILRAMNEDMVDLQDMMSLKDGTVDWANPGEKQWKYQAKRIQLSFSENGTRTVQALEKKIQDLKNLLELLDSTNDTLDGMKTISKDTTWGKLFESIRKHAVDLHSAITNSWKCNCEATHQSGLQLQKRQPSDISPRFIMNFALPPQDSAPKSLQRRVIIHAKESKHNSALPSPVPVQKTYITQLRTNFETKSLPDVNVTTLPIRSGPQSSSSSVSSSFSFSSIFTKSESNVTTTSSISIPNGTETLVENQSKKWGAMRKSKPKKSLRFESDLQADFGGVERVKASPTPSKEQNFPVMPPSSAVENSGTNIKIDDLCSSLKVSDADTECLGYLSDDEHQKHEVRWIQESACKSQGREEISLEKLLSSDGHLKLSRQKRYKIASIIASSLLQLQATPWLSENLEKKQILFYYQGSDVFVDEPYISHDFAAITTQPPKPSPAPRVLPRKTLSSLGILLLELCFGEPIESQTELRKGHLSSDGKALEGTDYLTAIEWLDKVAEEEPKMAPVIKWCSLHCCRAAVGDACGFILRIINKLRITVEINKDSEGYDLRDGNTTADQRHFEESATNGLGEELSGLKAKPRQVAETLQD
ncbi:hypothetical protein LARI1_G003501 [Lachnellula arida]|uniref:DUF7580 domain-containing protein n=1 Tax=Lachnellula arida TaxID=1316785 RepID=A0A8T9BFA7_9HELO|nr:hypothetical protein LARI1_G003501 [Lachnellula arida]